MQLEQFQLNSEIELRHWWFVARRRILSGLLSQIVPAGPETVVVDVGCGTGGNVGALGETYTCVGIDPSADAVRLAQERFPKVRFLCGHAPHDLGDWAAQASAFLATDVLEHIQDDSAFLAELVAAASPGTYFLLTVPADMKLWSPHDQSHGHYRRYDLAQLGATLGGLASQHAVAFLLQLATLSGCQAHPGDEPMAAEVERRGGDGPRDAVAPGQPAARSRVFRRVSNPHQPAPRAPSAWLFVRSQPDRHTATREGIDDDRRHDRGPLL